MQEIVIKVIKNLDFYLKDVDGLLAKCCALILKPRVSFAASLISVPVIPVFKSQAACESPSVCSCLQVLIRKSVLKKEEVISSVCYSSSLHFQRSMRQVEMSCTHKEKLHIECCCCLSSNSALIWLRNRCTSVVGVLVPASAPTTLVVSFESSCGF